MVVIQEVSYRRWCTYASLVCVHPLTMDKRQRFRAVSAGNTGASSKRHVVDRNANILVVQYGTSTASKSRDDTSIRNMSSVLGETLVSLAARSSFSFSALEAFLVDLRLDGICWACMCSVAGCLRLVNTST